MDSDPTLYFEAIICISLSPTNNFICEIKPPCFVAIYRKMSAYSFLKGQLRARYHFSSSNCVLFALGPQSQYIKDMGLGGGMIWALDLDDFRGTTCGCEPHPLLRTINRVLRGYSTPEPTCNA